jgi:hypothetical protein
MAAAYVTEDLAQILAALRRGVDPLDIKEDKTLTLRGRQLDLILVLFLELMTGQLRVEEVVQKRQANRTNFTPEMLGAIAIAWKTPGAPIRPAVLRRSHELRRLLA